MDFSTLYMSMRSQPLRRECVGEHESGRWRRAVLEIVRFEFRHLLPELFCCRKKENGVVRIIELAFVLLSFVLYIDAVIIEKGILQVTSSLPCIFNVSVLHKYSSGIGGRTTRLRISP